MLTLLTVNITTYSLFLFRVEKSCVGPTIIFAWTNNRRRIHQRTTDYPNNTPQDFNSEIFLLFEWLLYIFCHPQTDCFVVSQLISVTRHVRYFKLALETRLTLHQLDILPQSYRQSQRKRRRYTYSYYFPLFTYTLNGYLSAQFITRALNYASGNR